MARNYAAPQENFGCPTVEAGEALEEHRFVSLHTDGKLYHYQTDGSRGIRPLGTTFRSHAIGDNASYRPTSDPGIRPVVASAAITVGQALKPANDGKVAPRTLAGEAGLDVGVANAAAAADGDTIGCHSY